jgi:hypothetical protein
VHEVPSRREGLQTLQFRDRLRPPALAWIFDREDVRAREVVPETAFARVDVATEAYPADDNAVDLIVWREPRS